MASLLEHHTHPTILKQKLLKHVKPLVHMSFLHKISVFTGNHGCTVLTNQIAVYTWSIENNLWLNQQVLIMILLNAASQHLFDVAEVGKHSYSVQTCTSVIVLGYNV